MRPDFCSRCSKDGKTVRHSKVSDCPLGDISETKASIARELNFNVDSGCSNTLITDKKDKINSFQIYDTIHHPIQCANGSVMNGTKQLDLQCDNFRLSNVMAVPGLKGKLNHGSSPKKSSSKSPRPGFRFLSDVCGPINPITYDGKQYVVTFTDDYSREVYAFLLGSKSEVFHYFKTLDAIIFNLFGYHISYLRSDNGG